MFFVNFASESGFAEKLEIPGFKKLLEDILAQPSQVSN
jgi:hypothetical protein